jgi:hypothetical protein
MINSKRSTASEDEQTPEPCISSDGPLVFKYKSLTLLGSLKGRTIRPDNPRLSTPDPTFPYVGQIRWAGLVRLWATHMQAYRLQTRIYPYASGASILGCSCLTSPYGGVGLWLYEAKTWHCIDKRATEPWFCSFTHSYHWS